MTAHQRHILEPGPDHPITIEPFAGRVIVKDGGGDVIADSTEALVLKEASYPPVYYLPRGDVSRPRLEVSRTVTYCPYKGEASHMNLIDDDGSRTEDAVWSYVSPHAAVAAITDYLAFYPDKVEAIEATPA